MGELFPNQYNLGIGFKACMMIYINACLEWAQLLAIISASILFESHDILLKHINKESQNWLFTKQSRFCTVAAMGFKIQLMAVLLLAAVSGSRGTYIAYPRFINW